MGHCEKGKLLLLVRPSVGPALNSLEHGLVRMTQIIADTRAQENNRGDVAVFETRPQPTAYIFGTNMMCALGVPGYITHGALITGFSVMPSEAPVAFGM